MKKYTKVAILIIIFFIVLLLAVFLSSDERNIILQSNKHESYLIIGQNSIFTYQNKNIYNVTKNNEVRSAIDWEKFTILSDYKKIGNYLIHYDDKWYLFDDNKASIDYNEDNLIAYKSNYNLKYVYKDQNDVIENKYIDKVLEAKELSGDNIVYSSEVYFDIDNDGQNETFYVVGNSMPIHANDDKKYSITFMVKDEIIYLIDVNLFEDFKRVYCLPHIEGFMDLNSNNKNEIIISCNTMSSSQQQVNIYEFNKKNNKIYFQLKASNQ